MYTHADRSAQRSPQGQWSFSGGLPGSQHLFREIARRAAAHLPGLSNVAPWRLWLDAMRTEGYAGRMPSRIVSWRQFKAAAESSENPPPPPGFESQHIENAFKSSADFCLVCSKSEAGASPPSQTTESVGTSSLPSEDGRGTNAGMVRGEAFAIAILGPNRAVTVVRRAGTPQETRWNTRMGLYQANFIVPKVAAGDHPLVITISGQSSNNPLIAVSN